MQESTPSRVFRFGVFEADAEAGELRKQGIRIGLQEQPFQLLLMLLDKAGEVISRDEIRGKLWPPDTFVDFEQGIGTAIKKLRQALCDDAEVPRYIETIPRRGYRFVAPVERPPAVFISRDTHRDETPAPSIGQRATKVRVQPRHIKQPFAAIAVAAGLAILAAWLYRPQAAPLSRAIPLTAYEGDELWPDFSPDGNQVAFAWDGGADGKFHLYVKMIGTANDLQITNGNGEDMFPAWSPDGRWIAFQRWNRSGRHTMLVSPLGGPERTVADRACEADFAMAPIPQAAAFRLSWSHDSIWLACSSPEGSLVLLSAFDGQKRQLTTPPLGQRDLFPAFSPDGKSLLFEREVSFFNCDIYKLG
ncbi:MAG: winged helix-turn-helix domain-containing protein, partial [Bryobacteraceae bacterium]